MKIKNIKLSLLILGGLMIFSFAFFSYADNESNSNKNVVLDSDQDGLTDAEERTYGTNPQKSDTDGDGYSDGTEVKSGYDPLKPAPGDRIIEEETTSLPATEAAGSEENLTDSMVNRVSALMNGDLTGQNQDVSMEDVQEIIEEAMSAKVTEADLPQVSKDEIKIKKQDYAKLSATERTAKEKEDFVKYSTAIAYIISSNSTKPITSESDLKSTTDSVVQQISTAMLTRNPALLEGLSQNGEKMLNQMKEVEVPEDLVDLHVKGLAFAKYAMTLKDSLSPNLADPFSDLVKFSKMQSFGEVLLGFGSEMQSKITQYGITVSDASQLINYGTGSTATK
ncbi:MAG: hypothetical protein AAB487_00215 [Patescibacteria group bacterium]